MVLGALDYGYAKAGIFFSSSHFMMTVDPDISLFSVQLWGV
jgi:hypothetical protein